MIKSCPLHLYWVFIGGALLVGCSSLSQNKEAIIGVTLGGAAGAGLGKDKGLIVGAGAGAVGNASLGSSHTTVQTLFVTDRNFSGKNEHEVFGSTRGNLAYGTCAVSIPRNHRLGMLESPSIWRFQFREDIAKHVTLVDTTVLSKDSFYSIMKNRIHQSTKNSAFLFIHGYNVTFEDAARRTAQIAYDLGFDGAPIFYSWPSQGALTAYAIDEQNIEWGQANLKKFLEDFFALSDAKNVYLIAHSMGNRALTRVVTSLLTDKPHLRTRVTEIILTAPDIDAEIFKRDIAPTLIAFDRPITLYASSRDLALAASKNEHGYPRAGDSREGLVVLPGIETIDATNVDTNFLGHSYFAETRSVLSDMFYLIQNSQRAANRFGLRPRESPAGKHWEFQP